MINSTPSTETLFIKDIKWATDETDAVGKDVSNTNDEGLYPEHVHNCSGGKTAEGRVRDPKGRRERGGREEGSACEKVPEYVSAQKCT